MHVTGAGSSSAVRGSTMSPARGSLRPILPGKYLAQPPAATVHGPLCVRRGQVWTLSQRVCREPVRRGERRPRGTPAGSPARRAYTAHGSTLRRHACASTCLRRSRETGGEREVGHTCDSCSESDGIAQLCRQGRGRSPLRHRLSATRVREEGRHFCIEDVTMWDVPDAHRRIHGHAAVFRSWSPRAECGACVCDTW